MTVTILQAASFTDLGRRQANQDRVLVDHDHGVFVVADGMGGHRGGATAAEMAVSAISSSTVHDSASLIKAVETANSAIFERSRIDPDLQGMGTTLTALALVVSDGEERLSIAHVGDSRAYRLRAGELELLTEDHTIVTELVRDGQLTALEARNHRQRSVLTRAVGVESGVAVDVIEVLPSAGDRFLLCSDGLTGDVDSSQIAGILRRYADPGEACRDLIRVALAAGSKDNISALIIDVVEDDQSLFVDAGPSGLSSRTTSTPTSPLADDTLVLTRPPVNGRGDRPDETPTSARPAKRLVTFRTLAFAVLLAAIGGVAYWAISNAPNDDPGSTTTVVQTTTINSTSSTPSTSAAPSTTTAAGSRPTLALPSTAVGAATTGPLVPEQGLPTETVATGPLATVPVATTNPVRTLPTSRTTSTSRQ